MGSKNVVVEIDSISASQFILALLRSKEASSDSIKVLSDKDAPSNRQSAQIEGCG